MTAVLLALAVSAPSDFVDARIELRCETGEAFLSQGLLEEAESEFREALRLEPSCPAAVLGLGRIYRAREAWEQAETCLRQYTDSFPSDPAGLFELAGLLMDMDRAGEALDFASRAAESASTDGSAWLLAGRAGLASDDTTGAVRSLGRALELGGAPALEASVIMSGIALASDDTDLAFELLGWGVGEGHAPSCFRLGKLYVSWGDLVRGSALLRQSILISPSGPCSDSARILLDELAGAGFFEGPVVDPEN
ncbi:MAG: tetratricopeptide repeat protein [Candidatus Fermentibacter sp.]|nr:tetratricopeptide repeat protein [Candidatus Fermentibacter sp.]